MAKKSSTQIWLEYAAAWTILGFLGIVPRNAAIWFGVSVGRLAYHLLGRLRRVGLRNLESDRFCEHNRQSIRWKAVSHQTQAENESMPLANLGGNSDGLLSNRFEPKSGNNPFAYPTRRRTNIKQSGINLKRQIRRVTRCKHRHRKQDSPTFVVALNRAQS